MIRLQPATAGLSKQFLRFVGVNTVAALVNIGTRLVASFFMLDALAVLAGFCTGLSTSYLLCRNLVFQPSETSQFSELIRFIIVNLVALGITYGTYQLLLSFLDKTTPMVPASPVTQTLAHAMAVAAPVIFSFFGQRTITFRQRPD